MFWRWVWIGPVVGCWLRHWNRYWEQTVLSHPWLGRAGCYRPHTSASVVSFPCWRGRACPQSFLADSGDHLIIHLNCQFFVANVKRRNALWRVVTERPGYRCCKLHLCCGMQSFPVLLQGGWGAATWCLLVFPGLPAAGFGGWKALLTSLLLTITIVLPGRR